MSSVEKKSVKKPQVSHNLFDPVDTSSSSEEEFETTVNPLANKRCFIDPDTDHTFLLRKEITKRLSENQGETILDIGVQDGDSSGLTENEMDDSIACLRAISVNLNLQCMQLRRKKLDKEQGTVAMFMLREEQSDIDFIEIRVAVVGNVDAGKSTLLGVLTHGELDNGRGQARLKLFRHKHEKETGRTSSVGNDILGFSETGEIVNKADHGHLDWMKICQQSSKVITFIDLAGHEKYLKTTVFGMTGHAPDFTMLMIGANAGVIGMTKEHLGLALALNVPVFVVITKVDMCPPNVLEETLKILMKILKSPGCRKFPMMVTDEDDAITTATNFTSERMCPIFQVSNVTGQNLNLLKKFMNLLGSNIVTDITSPAEFQIDDIFSVPGVGVVVSGTTLSGMIRVNDVMNFGPDPVGQFQTQVVKSIHRKRMVVQMVRAGQTASFSLKKVKRNQIRKGMVLLSPSIEAIACWEFEGEMLVLHHPTTICPRYQAMVHVGSIRQTATILTMSRKHMRTGDKAICRFRFIKNPEYLKKDVKLIFREGRTKAVGTVTNVFPYVKGQKTTLPTIAKGQNSRRSRRDVIINDSA